EIGSINATNDASEGADYQPDLRALTAINPASENIAVARADGIAAALVRPEGGMISGQSAVVNLAGRTGEEMKVLSPMALRVTFPESPARFFRQFMPEEDTGQQSEMENARLRELRDYFEKAKRYMTARAKSSDSVPFDPRLEAMTPYVGGKLP